MSEGEPQLMGSFSENHGRTNSHTTVSVLQKPGRKRNGASRSAPAIVVTTDVSNFKAEVQKLTGMQSIPVIKVEVGQSTDSIPLKAMPKRPAGQMTSGGSNSNDMLPSFGNSVTYNSPSYVSNFTFQPLLQQRQPPFDGHAFDRHPFLNIISSATIHGDSNHI